jgi:hypothetical protein
MKAIFTNDDAGASANPAAVEWFRTVVDWLNRQQIRATFFWVPKPHDFEKCHDLWNATLHETRQQGHDFQLHGLTHSTCLEFGVPPPSTRRANPKPFEEYEAHRDHWEAEHSLRALTAKLKEANSIYQQIFGNLPKVFRAPCFGICRAMYEALAAVGIHCSSSVGINPTATAYTLLGDVSLRRWDPDCPCHPWVEPPGVWEIPCMEDLCIGGVPANQFDDRLDLVLGELRNFLQAAGDEGVLVLGSHYHSMMKTWSQTRALLERALEWLSQNGVSEWVTFEQFIANHGHLPRGAQLPQE